MHLNDRLAVDDQVVPAGHLLAYVQQQPVVTGLRNNHLCLEKMALAHFSSAAFRCGDVHRFTGTSTFLPDEWKTVAAGVEFRQAVVVPQNAIALA